MLVNYDTSLNTKLFDSNTGGTANAGDAALLSWRRHNEPMAPSVVINNDFKDLANILLGSRQQNDAAALAEPPKVPSQPALLLKITLEDFGCRFTLSNDILQKLATMKVTGPHSLWFITDKQLAKGGLDVGEIGNVRDA
ncbi:hypothetical protein JVT61DRAFT_4274 [Boletus reticuloceps]|uniref:Uncharacterized protein n=1 Tax=Boletus reticuloceps TaxID=495285 RepID=A0A8I2YNC6_9AGAM|nr:hypothetical protein JVT61DRAFT_4274 [Boletus reticuloceps]